MTDVTKRKIKAYIAFALFLAVIFTANWFGPLDGWKLWLALLVGVPFSIWVVVALLEYERAKKHAGEV
jgi:hypothetical protein